jgi:putative transposase
MFKGRHFDQSVILLCVRWYLAYNLSLRDLEEMMAERGLSVDHSTVHRWAVRFAPQLLERFNRRKRSVTDKWLPAEFPSPRRSSPFTQGYDRACPVT